ncbi:MAG TPA: DUF4352 domain-containing protein [Solirubrobacteraceae bacterium]|nr:DUF4352 domain-containing protein [Solirubrobacteraceae bacterium]
MGRFIVVVISATVAAGCGTQTIIKTVTTSSQSAAATQTQALTASQTAKVGDTLTLTGNGGESMAVTVDQVMDPLQVGPYDQADQGQRFVGIQITLKNVGSVAYSDAPENGATLLSNTREQAQSQIVSGGPCGNEFASSANIAPGDTQQGCIPFEMPVGQTPASFQFTLNSGFANQTGQWSLAGAATSGGSSGATTTSSNTASNTGGGGATTATCNEGPCVLTRMPNQCSRGLAATSSVSCGLASNVFYEYFQAERTGNTSAISAWSPLTKQYYSASCSSGDGLIDCSISGTTAPNAEVVITQAALDAYSPSQATWFASHHDVGPNG